MFYIRCFNNNGDWIPLTMRVYNDRATAEIKALELWDENSGMLSAVCVWDNNAGDYCLEIDH